MDSQLASLTQSDELQYKASGANASQAQAQAGSQAANGGEAGVAVPLTSTTVPAMAAGSLPSDAGAGAGGGAGKGSAVAAPRDRIASYGAAELECPVWTMEEALKAIGHGSFQRLLLVVCGLTFLADSVEVLLLSFLQEVLKVDWQLGILQTGILSGAVFAGELLGALVWGPVADRFGRRPTFIVIIACILVFGLASVFAPSFEWLVVARTVVGIAIGGFAVPYDLLAEYLAVEQRGKFLMMFQVFWSIGSICIAGMAWVILPSLGWRWLMALALAPVAVSLALSFTMPESAAWLATQDRVDEAVATLHLAAKRNGRTLPAFTLHHVHKPHHGSLRALLSPSLRRTTLSLWSTWAVFGMTYYGLVLLTPDLFSSPSDGDKYGINYGSVLASAAAELAGIAVGVALVDPLGRKRTMALTYSVSAVFGIGVALQMGVVLTTICSFVARMAIMIASSAVWLVTPELYPTAVRGTGHAWASSVSRFTAFLAPFVVGLDRINLWIPVIAFAALNFVGAAVSMCGLPRETAGQEMPQDFDERRPSDHRPLGGDGRRHSSMAPATAARA